MIIASILTTVFETGILLDAIPVVGSGLGRAEFTALGVSMILLLILGSGFFSSSEIAMFSLSPYQVDAMIEEGKRGAEAIESLKNDPHRLLVTILVGNNLVNITMSSISTTIVGFYLDAGIAVIVSSVGITSMVLLFGETAPKSYAVDNTNSWARTVAPLLKLVGKILWPLITVFYYLTQFVNKLTPGGSAIESSYVSRDDIRNMIKMGEREGILDEEERQILDRTLRFTDATAKEIMTPRLDMSAISRQLTVEEAIEECIQSGHARLPVYEESLDNIIGVFDIRELEDTDSTFAELTVADALNSTVHVPESKNVDELLSEMREDRIRMVIVIDEFGTTEGLITMEDVTEEIVGEILMDDEDQPIEFVNDNEVLVQGEVNVHEVNEILDIDLPEGEEFETIAGFVFHLAGRLVEQGEEFAYENVTLRTERLEDTRIRRVRIAVNPHTAETSETGE